MSDRYRVTERLEAGGMAEVFIGEAVSVQGFKKKVAIKRVLPHLAQNRNFMGMFLDEARLGAKLSHANVVSVFDIGAADNTYFIVMEYVDGGNLKSVMEALRKQGRHFPIKEAIYICMEACRGLGYAHDLTDDEGNPLNLVHRDVSPPNILISKRGEVKVTDFGLAKSITQLEKTDPGVVKGKFSYLSPEAGMGLAVDARADIFALGIVLWELLAGRRLFLGETDYQTVKLVQQANVPSIQRLNPEVDAEFEEVLRKALARDPAHRYQTAREFSDRLADYLFSHQLKVTSYDIGHLVKEALVHEQRPRASADQSIIDRLIQEELLRFTSLDEMSDPLNPGARPLSPEDVDGAKPLDAGAFENPAEWFSDDADVAAALDRHVGPGTPGWRESGVDDANRSFEPGDLASVLESSGSASEVPPPPRMPPEMQSPPRARMPTPPPQMQPLPPPPRMPQQEPPRAAKKKGGGGAAWMLVVLFLLLAGAGAAAAWYGGLF
jgi:serine/threonine-protein kinase